MLSRSPRGNSLREPEGDLLLGGLLGIAAVADVAADVESEVSADGAGGGVGGASGAQQLASFGEGVDSFPDHGDDGARGHVADESGEERLLLEVGVVLLHVLTAGSGELQSDELETLLFESEN
jgi:hypothetical protein